MIISYLLAYSNNLPSRILSISQKLSQQRQASLYSLIGPFGVSIVTFLFSPSDSQHD